MMNFISLRRHKTQGPGHLYAPVRRAAILLVILLSYSTLSSADLEYLDGIVAIVNNDVVLQSELDDRMQAVLYNLRSTGQPIPPERVIRQDLLNQLILESIQRQIAARSGIRIGDTELNNAMERVAAQNNMDLLQFKTALEEQGLDYAKTREQIRLELLLRNVQQGAINPRIRITNQEIDNFIESKEGQALTAPDYRVLHALIALPTNANAGAIAIAHQEADVLYQAIETGSSFESVINDAGIEITDLGWRTDEELPSLLKTIVPTLLVGETAPPLQSASGFHLILLADKRGDSQTINQTKARHILLKTSIIRDDQATEAEINDLRRHAIEQGDFLALARQYSDDIGSALEGGDLGWTSPGQLDPTFQDRMDNTAIGQISPAFRTPFGWHIVLVEDRRETDVTESLRRRLAESILHQRQYQDELEAWLQQIRSEAYVEIKSLSG